MCLLMGTSQDHAEDVEHTGSIIRNYYKVDAAQSKRQGLARTGPGALRGAGRGGLISRGARDSAPNRPCQPCQSPGQLRRQLLTHMVVMALAASGRARRLEGPERAWSAGQLLGGEAAPSRFPRPAAHGLAVPSDLRSALPDAAIAASRGRRAAPAAAGGVSPRVKLLLACSAVLRRPQSRPVHLLAAEKQGPSVGAQRRGR